MAPKDEYELQHLIKTALTYDGPASVRYPRGVSLGVSMDPKPAALPIGKGELMRDGSDVAIVAVGVALTPLEGRVGPTKFQNRGAGPIRIVLILGDRFGTTRCSARVAAR